MALPLANESSLHHPYPPLPWNLKVWRFEMWNDRLNPLLATTNIRDFLQLFLPVTFIPFLINLFITFPSISFIILCFYENLLRIIGLQKVSFDLFRCKVAWQGPTDCCSPTTVFVCLFARYLSSFFFIAFYHSSFVSSRNERDNKYILNVNLKTAKTTLPQRVWYGMIIFKRILKK